MDKKYLIIYHKEDNDGVFSAAIFYNYLNKTLNIDTSLIDLLPADYNYLNKISQKYDIEKLHDEYKMIIMTDISFNDINYMKLLYEEFKNNFIWCDHHAPIIKLTNKTKLINIPGIRDKSCSAILCVYRYLYDPFNVEQDSTPKLFKVLSAWDSFTFKENGYTLDYVKNVNIGVNYKYQLNIDKVIPIIQEIIDSYNIDNKDCAFIDNKHIDELLLEQFENYGKIINNYQDFINKSLMTNSADYGWKLFTGETLFDNTLIYRTAVAIFMQGPSNSLMFKSINKNKDTYDEIMNGIVFKHNNDSTWTISLYNIREDDSTFHCGDFLKKFYNGGGHMGAAGCTISEDEFIKILKTKILGNYESIF